MVYICSPYRGNVELDVTNARTYCSYALNNNCIPIALHLLFPQFMNTLDCLNYVRELKALGIGITFEKEGINTLESSGEVLLTILTSLSQDESRSISENTRRGLCRRYENGEYGIVTKRFMGYDRDSDGKLDVNKKTVKGYKKDL